MKRTPFLETSWNTACLNVQGKDFISRYPTSINKHFYLENCSIGTEILSLSYSKNDWCLEMSSSSEVFSQRVLYLWESLVLIYECFCLWRVSIAIVAFLMSVTMIEILGLNMIRVSPKSLTRLLSWGRRVRCHFARYRGMQIFQDSRVIAEAKTERLKI